jgi:DNA-binding NarL/FixJ family response regulator
LAGAWQVDARRAAAWVDVAGGRLSRAQAELEGVAASCRSNGSRYFEALSLHDHLRITPTATVADRLDELASQASGAWIPALAAHARAAITEDGPALDAASVQLEATGALLQAAEASWQAVGAHRRVGLRAREAAAATRASALRTRCGAVQTPALSAVAEGPALTAREREVVAMVRRGLSNRAIAETMVVSVRTIEGHVLRACAKVGATNRTELVELLGPLV